MGCGAHSKVSHQNTGSGNKQPIPPENKKKEIRDDLKLQIKEAHKAIDDWNSGRDDTMSAVQKFLEAVEEQSRDQKNLAKRIYSWTSEKCATLLGKSESKDDAENDIPSLCHEAGWRIDTEEQMLRKVGTCLADIECKVTELLRLYGLSFTTARTNKLIVDVLDVIAEAVDIDYKGSIFLQLILGIYTGINENIKDQLNKAYIKGNLGDVAAAIGLGKKQAPGMISADGLVSPEYGAKGQRMSVLNELRSYVEQTKKSAIEEKNKSLLSRTFENFCQWYLQVKSEGSDEGRKIEENENTNALIIQTICVRLCHDPFRV